MAYGQTRPTIHLVGRIPWIVSFIIALSPQEALVLIRLYVFQETVYAVYKVGYFPLLTSRNTVLGNKTIIKYVGHIAGYVTNIEFSQYSSTVARTRQHKRCMSICGSFSLDIDNRMSTTSHKLLLNV